MKKLRLIALAAAGSAVIAGGANAAETYVSLGLGIAEEQVTMNSLVPGFSACSDSADFFPPYRFAEDSPRVSRAALNSSSTMRLPGRQA